MSEAPAPGGQRLVENMPVDATDGACGELADVVIDPVRRTLTHLVVRPDGLVGRLVPVAAVVEVGERLRLSWSCREVRHADSVVDTDFRELSDWPHLRDGWDVGIVRTLAHPYYVGETSGREDVRTTTEFDRIPEGTAEIRRASRVEDRDGELLGHVDGLVLGPDHAITHVVLEKGHLWGHREVTIPVADVERVESDLVRLRVGKEEVGAYPSVPFHRHH